MIRRFFASAWHAADEVFAPRDLFLRHADEEIKRLYKWRSIIGSFIILCVALRYHHFSGFSETYDAIYQSVDWTIEFALIAVIPAGAAVVLYTVPDRRRDALIQMRYPATALGTWVVVFYASRLLLAIPFLGFVALVWLAAFGIRMLYQMATGMFRLGDGHPLLPPAVTVLAAWCMALKGLAAGTAESGEPAPLAFIMLIGGPISLTVLAAMEIERLKDRHPDDFPFRNGPLR